MNGRVISFVVFRNSVLSLYLRGWPSVLQTAHSATNRRRPKCPGRLPFRPRRRRTRTTNAAAAAAATFPSKSTRLAIVPMTPLRRRDDLITVLLIFFFFTIRRYYNTTNSTQSTPQHDAASCSSKTLENKVI